MLARIAVAAVLVTALGTGCGRYGYGEPAAGGDGDGDGGAEPDAVVAADCADIPGVLVCSGFEGDIGDWELESERGGTLTDVCDTPHAGQQCLVAHVDDGGAAARAWRSFPAVGSGLLYARMYMLIDAAAEIDSINVLSLDAENSGVYGPDVNFVDGGFLEVYLEQASGESGRVGLVPRGQWVCVRLGVSIDDTAGLVEAGYGAVSIEQNGVDTFPNGPYDYLAVGLDWTSNQQTAMTISIDDVVVATSPLACP